MPKLTSLAQSLPPEFRLTLADVGSAGGLKPRWQPIGSHLRALLFDPRDAESAVIESGTSRSYPVALAEAPGTRELRITDVPILSSLLEPGQELLTLYRKKGVQGKVAQRVNVQVEALDTLMQRDGIAVDAMKIDTQGTELDILKGAVGALERSVLMVEAEMSFFERYIGQAVAADMLAWMHSRGFRLIEMYRPKRYIRLNSFDIGNVGVGTGHRAGQLGHCDAIFVASDELLARRWAGLPPETVRHQALALMVLLLVYGKVDVGAAMYDRHKELLDAATRENLQRWLVRWHRAEYRTRGWHAVADWFARKV